MRVDIISGKIDHEPVDEADEHRSAAKLESGTVSRGCVLANAELPRFTHLVSERVGVDIVLVFQRRCFGGNVERRLFVQANNLLQVQSNQDCDKNRCEYDYSVESQ